jgi:azurin
MIIQPQLATAQYDGRLVRNARAYATRCLAVLTLLALLAACGAPPATKQAAAEPRVVKASEQSKPLRAITKPLPAAEAMPIAAPPATPAATATLAATATPAPAATPAAAATPARTAQILAIGTNGGEWEFDLSMLEIAAEKDVALTFSNSAKTTLHNWLLIDGDDYAAIEVSQAGAQAGQAADYIPDDARVIASTTGLIEGGQSQRITFAAPPAGTYVFLCTVPGHFELGMHGVLVVR